MSVNSPIGQHMVSYILADGADGSDAQASGGGPFDSAGTLKGGANSFTITLHDGAPSIPMTSVGMAWEKQIGLDTGHGVMTDSPDRQITLNITSWRDLSVASGTGLLDFVMGRHAGAVSVLGADSDGAFGFWMKVLMAKPSGTTRYMIIGHCTASPTLQFGNILAGSLQLDVHVPLWAKDVGGTNVNKRPWERGIIYAG